MINLHHFPAAEEKAHATPGYLPRRNFLSKLGGAAALTAFLASCNKDADLKQQTNGSGLLADEAAAKTKGAINFGTGDTAILNYAFLLEQLEAQFYTMLTASFYNGIKDKHKKRFEQIRDHEIAHREFFKTALGGDAIPDIMFDLSSVDFTSHMSVVQTAIAFEDLGVSAYNGVATKIVNADYLLLAGKIVSVEARHAAFVRDIMQPVSFANSDVVNDMGLDLANPPRVVIEAVKPYLPKNMRMSNLPG